MKYIFILFFLFFTVTVSYSQYDELPQKFKVNIDGYEFRGKYDTLNYTSVLTISKGGKNLYKSEFSKISYIKAVDLDNDGVKEALIDTYSGGAHCCYETYIIPLKTGSLSVKDTIAWGDSYYWLKDLNNDGNLELTGYNVAPAYSYTNFAESVFPVRIVKYKYGKSYEANSEFKDYVSRDADTLVNELNTYLKENTFNCPVDTSAETFNTSAGAVKAYLAAIMIDYNSIGESEKGYELINRYYQCPDKEKFIQSLRDNFEVK